MKIFVARIRGFAAVWRFMSAATNIYRTVAGNPEVMELSSIGGEAMKRKTVLLVSAVLSALGTHVGASDASTLTGNSLELSWTEERQIVNPRGEQKSAPVVVHVGLYLSSKGRFFTKVDIENRFGMGKMASQVDGQAGNAWQWHASGSGVSGFGRVGSTGARKVDIVLTGAGACSATAVMATKVGESGISIRNARGVPITIISNRVVGTTCTFRQGNIFAR